MYEYFQSSTGMRPKLSYLYRVPSLAERNTSGITFDTPSTRWYSRFYPCASSDSHSDYLKAAAAVLWFCLISQKGCILDTGCDDLDDDHDGDRLMIMDLNPCRERTLVIIRHLLAVNVSSYFKSGTGYWSIRMVYPR